MNCKKKYLTYFMVVLALVAVRWVDCKIMWELGKWEYLAIPHTPGFSSEENQGHTVFLGFSTHKRASEVLKRERAATDKDVVVVSYYNLLFPSAHLCYNKSPQRHTMLTLPWGGGLLDGNSWTEFYHLKCDALITKRRNSWDISVVRVLGSLIDRKMMEARLRGAEKAKAEVAGDLYLGFGFVTYYSSKILRQIYIFYFYFPLIAIVLLAIFYSRKMLVALAYYIVAPFVFHPVNFWLAGRLFGKYQLIDNFHWSVWQSFAFLVYLIVLYFFIIKYLRKGNKLRKQEPLTFTEKAVVWFFFLFLVVVRF
jgi:hypothetical protein